MADILTDEQVREIALAIGHKPFVGSLIAKIRHVQAELEDARKGSWDAWADEHNSLREENARLQAENERLEGECNNWHKQSVKLLQENARLRETLGHLYNRLEDPTYTVEEHKAYIGQALATEGEEKDEPTIPQP